jgi:exodeoxyribonuclease VII large subunit
VAQLCQALVLANQRQEVDVIILGRGGGSLEDLWCFNSEVLARSIFASRLPIISAVGHEVDVSIADFVADLRAPTPSAAAELVSRDQNSVNLAIINLRESLVKQLAAKLQTWRAAQQLMEQRLQQNHPQKRVQQQVQRVDQLTQRLERQIQGRIRLEQTQIGHVQQRLMQHTPAKWLALQTKHYAQLNKRFMQQWHSLLTSKQQRLSTIGHLLDTVSPLATLGRGYSISFKADVQKRQIVRSVTTLTVGDALVTRLADGEVSSKIIDIKPIKKI